MADEKTTPAHYGGAANLYETIKVLRVWLPAEVVRGFTLGNAIKYLSRAGKKPGESVLDDLRKSRWYIDNEIQAIEEQEQAGR